MRTAAALSALMITALTGCAATMSGNTPDQAEAVPPEPAAMVCNAAAAQSHIGQSATQAMGAAVLKDAGARTLRWGPPGAAWTRDYRQDRVNVSYGADMIITEITCG
jgi:hypothetical protein